jgi:hypothetical protein
MRLGDHSEGSGADAILPPDLCGIALGLLAAMPARAQTGFDRPGGD